MIDPDTPPGTEVVYVPSSFPDHPGAPLKRLVAGQLCTVHKIYSNWNTLYGEAPYCVTIFEDLVDGWGYMIEDFRYKDLGGLESLLGETLILEEAL